MELELKKAIAKKKYSMQAESGNLDVKSEGFGGSPKPKELDIPEVNVDEASLKHDVKNYHDLYDNMPGSSSGQQNLKKELEKRIQQYKIKKGL